MYKVLKAKPKTAPKKETIPQPAMYSKRMDFSDKKLRYNSVPISRFIKPKTGVNKLASRKTIATADAGTRSIENVALKREIDLIQVVQPPYTDGDLGKFEAAARRNLAVRAAITVRQHFAFGKPSKLVIELNESDKLDKDQEQQAEEVEKLTKANMELLKRITDVDEKIELVKNSTGPFYWQNLMFGNGVMIKFYMDKEFKRLKKIMPINSRRLGLVILNSKNLDFEGIYVDGSALDKQSMIYGTYQEVQISPYSEHYGYAALEPIVHIAESHNIATEEDIKEIMKSAWLKAIMFIVNTAGLDSTDATAQIQTIIDAINPGKYIGVNTDVKEAVPLDLNPDYKGIVEMVDSLESKIFKSLFVPQFLVQSEDMANMATANKSATLFIDGIISFDQTWMQDTLWKQHYEILLRQELGLEVNLLDPLDEPKPLPFKIKRVWEKPTVEEFMELADALQKLTGSKAVWDVEQANKILNTPEVAKRVIEQEKKNEANMQLQEKPPGKSPIGTPKNQ